MENHSHTTVVLEIYRRDQVMMMRKKYEWRSPNKFNIMSSQLTICHFLIYMGMMRCLHFLNGPILLLHLIVPHIAILHLPRMLRKGKAKSDYVNSNFRIMTESVASIAPKIDGLINVLSNEKEVAEVQARLKNKMVSITDMKGLDMFRATNILAAEHDILRVFFTMEHDILRVFFTMDAGEEYVQFLLEHGL